MKLKIDDVMWEQEDNVHVQAGPSCSTFTGLQFMFAHGKKIPNEMKREL